MKNWVISENKEVVYKVGEFFIQVTTVEYILEQIYAEFVNEVKVKEKFSGMTLGKKIDELSKRIKIEGSDRGASIKERLLNLNEFRNKIAHNVFEYNPNDKKVYVKNKILDEEIDKKISDVGELLIDIDIMLSFVKDGKGYKYSITKHVVNR